METNFVNYHGVPGSGKTRTVVAIFDQTVRRIGPERVAYVSFTRTAAEEARQRAAHSLGIRSTSPQVLKARLPFVGTIHSLCYRLLGVGRDQMVSRAKLAEFADLVNASGRPTGFEYVPEELDAPYMLIEGKDDLAGMQLLSSTAAHRMISSEEALDVIPVEYIDQSGAPRLLDLVRKYAAWKREHDYLDFDDLLIRGREERLPVACLIADECQPTGTMVYTAEGRGLATRLSPKPIEDVRVGDRVASYDRKGLKMGASRVSAMRERQYDGPMIVVDVGGHRSRYTPEHPCVVKVSDAFRRKHVVYMMRRGDQYRVGVSSAYRDRACASTGIKGRMLEEGADGAWVLAVFDDRKEAYIQENLVTARFGIPQTRFKEGGAPKSIGQDHVDTFWGRLGSNRSQAADCLVAFGRDINYPLVDKARYFLYNRAVIVHAGNLVDGMTMLDADEVLSRPGRKAHRVDSAWKPIQVARESYAGTVYSLTVDPAHTYVADGVVTHNCQDNSPLLWDVIDRWAQQIQLVVTAGDPFQALYLFNGADPSLFLKRPGRWVHLDTTHRFDQESVEYARDVLKNAYGPDETSGLDGWEGVGGEPRDGTTLCLARTNFLLRTFEADFQEKGIPYRTYRGKKGPLDRPEADAYRTGHLLLHGESVSADRLLPLAATMKLPAQPIKAMGDREVERGEAEALLGRPVRYLMAYLPNVDYYDRVVTNHGTKGLMSEPKHILSTIHGAKGREADNVILLSKWGWIPGRALADPQGNRSETCVAYVACSRHRVSLELWDDGDGYPFPFPDA